MAILKREATLNCNDDPVTSNSRFYFAYGSNMDGQQMAERCPGASLESIGSLGNHMFLINSRGVATIVPHKGREVYGLLWTITESDENNLDESEGVKWGTYRKVTIEVLTQNGKSLQGMVYLAKDSTSGSPRKGYMEKIVSAAEKHGLPKHYCEELRTWLK